MGLFFKFKFKLMLISGMLQVRTDMGGTYAHLSKEESIGDLIKTLHTLTPEHTGKYVTWNGDRLPW